MTAAYKELVAELSGENARAPEYVAAVGNARAQIDAEVADADIPFGGAREKDALYAYLDHNSGVPEVESIEDPIQRRAVILQRASPEKLEEARSQPDYVNARLRFQHQVKDDLPVSSRGRLR